MFISCKSDITFCHYVRMVKVICIRGAIILKPTLCISSKVTIDASSLPIFCGFYVTEPEMNDKRLCDQLSLS